MLETIFGSKCREQVLQFILANENGYASQIARFYNISTDPVIKQLNRLETGGVLVSKSYGKSRIYNFNPRYTFLEELKVLLLKARDCYKEDLKESLIMIRKRPRRNGKPL